MDENLDILSHDPDGLPTSQDARVGDPRSHATSTDTRGGISGSHATRGGGHLGRLKKPSESQGQEPPDSQNPVQPLQDPLQDPLGNPQVLSFQAQEPPQVPHNPVQYQPDKRANVNPARTRAHKSPEFVRSHHQLARSPVQTRLRTVANTRANTKEGQEPVQLEVNQFTPELILEDKTIGERSFAGETSSVPL